MRGLQALLQRADDIGARSVRQSCQLRKVLFRLVRRATLQRRRDEDRTFTRVFRLEYVRAPVGCPANLAQRIPTSETTPVFEYGILRPTGSVRLTSPRTR